MMALNDRLRGIVDWLNEGYPSGVPAKDYIPLLALLRRRLTEEEVREIAEALGRHEDPSRTDIGVHITQITDALPSDEDVRRVEQHLDHLGWPDHGTA